MRRAARPLLQTLLLLSGLAATPPIPAITPGPLPVFTLKSSADASVDSRALGSGRNWLLIYIREDSGAARELLGSLERQAQAGAPGRIAIVCGGGENLLHQLAGAHPRLARELFFHDDKGEFWALLKLHHSPMVAGMTGGNIRWVMNGLGPASRTWQSALADWLEASAGGASAQARRNQPAGKPASTPGSGH